MAVAFDAKTTTYKNVNAVATLTVSNLTVGSGSNRAMKLQMSWSTGSIPANVVATWDSGGTNQAMTLIPGSSGATGSSSVAVAEYGLINPTSGNKNLVVSWTGNFEAHAVAISFTGVDQTSVAVAFPNGTATLNTSAVAGPCSLTITSATGNMVTAGHINQAAAWGAINNTKLASDDVTGPAQGVASNYANGSSTVTLTAAFSGTDKWASFGSDVLAAGAGGAAFLAKNNVILRAVARASYI